MEKYVWVKKRWAFSGRTFYLSFNYCLLCSRSAFGMHLHFFHVKKALHVFFSLATQQGSRNAVLRKNAKQLQGSQFALKNGFWKEKIFQMGTTYLKTKDYRFGWSCSPITVHFEWQETVPPYIVTKMAFFPNKLDLVLRVLKSRSTNRVTEGFVWNYLRDRGNNQLWWGFWRVVHVAPSCPVFQHKLLYTLGCLIKLYFPLTLFVS